MLTKEQKELVENNHKLIYYYIHKNGLSVDEYYDILAIGLCKAALNFDESKGIKFVTYAMFVMRNEHWVNERLKRNKKRNSSVLSLSTKIQINEDSNDMTLEDFIPGDRDIFDSLILLDIEKILKDETLIKICKLALAGYNQREMKEYVNLSQSMISRKLKKIEKLLKEEAIYD